MREIKINGKTFDIRSLKRSELRDKTLTSYGYRPAYFKPVMLESGETDLDAYEKGQDFVLKLVLGSDGYARLEEADGERGIRQVWLEIIRETYGDRNEEKNLSAPPESGASE